MAATIEVVTSAIAATTEVVATTVVVSSAIGATTEVVAATNVNNRSTFTSCSSSNRAVVATTEVVVTTEGVTTTEVYHTILSLLLLKIHISK